MVDVAKAQALLENRRAHTLCSALLAVLTLKLRPIESVDVADDGRAAVIVKIV